MLSKQKNRRRQPRRQSAKPPMAKYYSSSSESGEQKSPFRKSSKQPSRRSRVLGRLFDLLVLSAVIIFLLYGLSVKSPARVRVNSDAYHPAEVYEQYATEQLSDVKNKTKLTFDEQGITADLKEKYPEIADIDIQLPILSQQPTLQISIYPPTLYLDGPGGRFVIDSQGRSVGTADDFPRVKELITLVDESDFVAKIGEPVLSQSSIIFISGLTQQLKKNGIPISSLILPPRAQELSMRTADRPYFVKFYLDGDPVIQVGQYLAARAQLDRDKTTPSQYLDARVQGKVFYK